MRIALVAGTRFPVAEPFAGGMEAHTWLLAQGLTERGHDVTVFAAPGSDPSIARIEVIDGGRFEPSARARADVSMPPDRFLREHHAYQSLMLRLAADTTFDVVHLNTLHHLPVAMAELLPRPPLLTLHTPPTPWLESALTLGTTVRPVAVSQHTADAWRPMTGPIPVLHNGIDLQRWTAGPGGAGAVWTGRLVPEKAPHLAVTACRRAGLPLRLAGPAPDEHYLRTVLMPMLGPDAEWVGHLDHDALRRLVGAAAVCVVTPCWDEPFGLVVAEALAAGTPVAAFRRGALAELVTPECAVLVDGGDVDALAVAIRSASRLDRGAARRHAELSVDSRRMVAGYEQLYRADAPVEAPMAS
ncbi:glycosyltransferase family 4 protein [Angustibacter luteus]